MDFHGFLWICVDFNGFLWISMDVNGFLWIFIDFNGFLWISMDFHWSRWMRNPLGVDPCLPMRHRSRPIGDAGSRCLKTPPSRQNEKRTSFRFSCC